MTDESENSVENVPDNFKDWVVGNEERINNAKSLPYFLRDNEGYMNKALNIEQPVPQEPEPKELSTLEKAALRHSQRTKEQEQAIRDAWEERRKHNALVNKTASNVLKVAKDYGEVDYSGLESAISSGNINEIESVTRATAKQVVAMKKAEEALSDLIPDVHKWHKQTSLTGLQAVHDAVESKLSSWAHLPLESQKKKLTFEAVDFLGGNMKGVQQKYPDTWKVSQAAYLKKLGEVENQIKLNKIIQDADVIKLWSASHPKSVKVTNLLGELDAAIANGEELQNIQAKFDAVNKVYQIRLYQAKQRLAKKQGGSVQFGSECFTKKRKDAAVWDKGNGQLADDTLFPDASKVWSGALIAEKNAMYDYTSHYCDVNEPLQGRKYYNSNTRKNFEKKVNNMTSYIEKCSLPKDMWFMRGDDGISVIQSRIEFAGGVMPTKLTDLVGMTMQEGGFMSTGCRKGSGFRSKSVILNIYAPKGAKAAYVEPFSSFGNGGGRSWDGVSRATSFGGEQECLFQRGTLMRITKVEISGGITYIDAEVIGRELKDLSYVPDANIGW